MLCLASMTVKSNLVKACLSNGEQLGYLIFFTKVSWKQEHDGNEQDT